MTVPRTHRVPHADHASCGRRRSTGAWSRPGDSTVVVESFLDGREATTVTTDDHDGQVVLPTVLPVDDTGAVVARGRLRGAVRVVPGPRRRAPARAGPDPRRGRDDLDYSTPATRDVYRRTHRERKDRLGGAGVFPGAGGILMSRLAHPAPWSRSRSPRRGTR